MSLLAVILHIGLMLGATVLLAGALPWAEALLAGRFGPPFWQPLLEARRLLRKHPVVTEAASPVLLATPVVCLVATALAALLVPSFTLGMATAPLADLLVIAGLLGLCRVAWTLAALDCGTAATGLAAVRTMRAGALACPALLLALLAVGSVTGTTNLDAALGGLRDTPALPLLLAACALGAMAVALHGYDEDLFAELSGWHLAAAQAAVALRLVVWLSLVADLLLPLGLAPAGSGVVAWLIGIAAWAGKLAVLGAASAAAQVALRWSGNGAVAPLLGVALLLGLLAVLFLFAAQTFA
jgi:formate hydrogenlyase subunit 4